MITLLRSLIPSQEEDDPELFMRNLTHLSGSALGFTSPEDNTIYAFIREFAETHNHVPSASSIRDHFESIQEPTVVDRLDAIRAVKQPLVRGDFLVRLEARANEQRMRVAGEILRDAQTILMQGLKVREGRKELTLKGAQDAIHYILDRANAVTTPTTGSRLGGEVTASGAYLKDMYLRVKNDPMSGIGCLTGLWQMDSKLFGAKPKELWVHAAYTSHGKSLFMTNWAYNQSVYYGNSVCIFSLEMNFDQLLAQLYTMHSFHEKFKGIRHALGLQSSPSAEMGLDYGMVKRGKLEDFNPSAEKFFLEHVIPDFENANANGYGKIHIEVAPPDRSTFKVSDMKARAEQIFSREPFSMLVVDHAGLVSPVKPRGSMTEDLNEVMRDLKKLSQSFFRGRGIAVLALFQINRQGFQAALKIQEKTGCAMYNLTHLSYANEAERSGDIVTASWLDDDLKKRNRIQFQLLKSRDEHPFDIFLARIEWPCKRILTAMDEVDVQELEGDDLIDWGALGG